MSRLPRGNPSAPTTSWDLNQAPLGVADTMLPSRSMTSTCTVPGPHGLPPRRCSGGSSARPRAGSPGRISGWALSGSMSRAQDLGPCVRRQVMLGGDRAARAEQTRIAGVCVGGRVAVGARAQRRRSSCAMRMAPSIVGARVAIESEGHRAPVEFRGPAAGRRVGRAGSRMRPRLLTGSSRISGKPRLRASSRMGPGGTCRVGRDEIPPNPGVVQPGRLSRRDYTALHPALPTERCVPWDPASPHAPTAFLLNIGADVTPARCAVRVDPL